MKKFILKSKKILYRAIPFVVALILFCYSGTGASAAYNVIDYRDYAEQVDYENGETNYFVVFPVKNAFWQWGAWPKDGGKDILTYGDGQSFYCRYDRLFHWKDNQFVFNDRYTDSDTELVCRPLGYDLMDLTYVPNGTNVKFFVQMSMDFDFYQKIDIIESAMYFQYFDKNGNAISNESVLSIFAVDIQDELNIFTWEYNGNIQKPAGAVSMMPRVRYSIYTQGIVSNPQFYIFVKTSPFQMNIKVSDLFVLQAETGKTNYLLEGLQDQNNTLINGTPEQNEKVDAAVGELDSAGDRLGNLTEDMKVDKPDLSGVDVSPDALVSPIDRATLTAPLVKLWENPTILGMITIVFVLILVSWVFFGKKD